MPGINSSVQSRSPEQIHRIAGTDVAQLLHDIGEASANTNQLELFRLCLAAQRMLVESSTVSARGAA